MSDQDEKKEVAVFEAIVNNKEIATTEDKKVPLLAMVLSVTSRALVVRR